MTQGAQRYPALLVVFHAEDSYWLECVGSAEDAREHILGFAQFAEPPLTEADREAFVARCLEVEAVLVVDLPAKAGDRIHFHCRPDDKTTLDILHEFVGEEDGG